jgi:glycyl-tRNA synthetase
LVEAAVDDMSTIVSLCKRRGFIFPSSEIYGGLGSTWDYGPLGVELKRNVKDAWWRAVVRDRDDMVGQDSAILMHPQTWVASGHVEGFSDPLIECRECHHRFRADHVDSKTCPDCGAVDRFTAPRQFNLMFKTFLGPVEDEAAVVYLRPETAQGMFVNFQNVQTSARMKVPFGIAQVGKSFRNEITPGNFTFRTREFEQMEIEYFVRPDQGFEYLEIWKNERMRWYTDYGINPERLKLREHDSDELAHYAKATFDIEYLFPIGWSELEGIAYRGDFDLSQHEKHSGKSMSYFDTERDERFIPHVVEPSGGVDRALLAFLVDAFTEEEVRGEKRTVLKLHKDLAPYKIAVLPLSKNEKLIPKAREVHDLIRHRWMTEYDDTQSIGRRYRRQDEIGTPLCVTVDFETVEEDNAVTIRDRDSMEQVRVSIPDLVAALDERLGG